MCWYSFFFICLGKVLASSLSPYHEGRYIERRLRSSSEGTAGSGRMVLKPKDGHAESSSLRKHRAGSSSSKMNSLVSLYVHLQTISNVLCAKLVTPLAEWTQHEWKIGFHNQSGQSERLNFRLWVSWGRTHNSVPGSNPPLFWGKLLHFCFKARSWEWNSNHRDTLDIIFYMHILSVTRPLGTLVLLSPYGLQGLPSRSSSSGWTRCRSCGRHCKIPTRSLNIF